MQSMSRGRTPGEKAIRNGHRKRNGMAPRKRGESVEGARPLLAPPGELSRSRAGLLSGSSYDVLARVTTP